MTIGGFLQQSWIKRLQGEYVLPTARVLYLAIAGLSLLAAVLGILAVIALEFSAHQSAALKPVPDVSAPASVSLDLDAISNGFLPPSNVHAVPLAFTRPISTDTVLLYFDASSARGLAQYPDDFLILGGPDAGLFERVVFPEIPPRVEYRLTPFGRKFVRLLREVEKLQAELDRQP